MKNIYILFLIILFGSCIDNNSDPGTNLISRIMFDTTFKVEAYRVDLLDTFYLECPKVIQENKEKPLQYRWDINYKTVSTEKNLKFYATELTKEGPFTGRLVVSNEDGESYLNFNLVVASPFQEGIMLMSKTTEGTMLSFKREDVRDKEFLTHIYQQVNPDFPLGDTPVAMSQVGDYMYLLTEDPVTLIKTDAITMEALNLIKVPNDNRLMGMYGPSGSGYSDLYVFDDGRIMELDGTQDAWMNMTQQDFDDAFPGEKFANKALVCSGEVYFYNDIQGLLIKRFSVEPICKDQFFGKKLVDYKSCGNGSALAIVENPTGDLEVIYFDPTNETVHQTYSCAGSGITAQSALAITSEYARLYYSVGNEIYVHDYTSATFPTSSKYTVGTAGDIIKSMIFNPDESKLYVAYESASGGELKGCVKSILLKQPSEDIPEKDLADWQREWEYKGIAGEIVSMIYKRE